MASTRFKPMLAVFVDGLKPDALKHMPFLNAQRTKRRLRTELGYSPTCYASMFTGVYPQKHLHWFTWLRSPGTSPFRRLRKLGLDRLPHNLATRYVLHKLVDRLSGGIVPWQGVMTLPWWYVPAGHWHLFDLAVKRSWAASGYVEGYPSIFELLPQNGMECRIVGLEAPDLEHSAEVVAGYGFDDLKPFTFCYVGDVDTITHWHGQDSDFVTGRLAQLDAMFAEKYRQLQTLAGDCDFLLFSDHGHCKIEEFLDLKAFFGSHGAHLMKYVHFIDANFARFWFRNAAEEKQVRGVLEKLGEKGRVLSEADCEHFHVRMPDNRFGDLVYYLDTPCAFSTKPRAVSRFRKEQFVSMHGYSPDNPESDGVLVANLLLREGRQIELVDIPPLVLDAFGIAPPAYMDGESPLARH